MSFLDKNGLTRLWAKIKAKFVAKEDGKALSTNDYTTAEKEKLRDIQAGAEVNVQSDWNQANSSADDYIKNKPTKVSQFTNDSNFTTKTYVDNEINDVVEIAEGKTKNYVISYVTISGYVNNSFNSTNETIALTIGSNKVRDISGNDVALSSLKVGDIVSITETSVPDRWVGSITSTTITFYKMETKIDVVNAITQNDTRPITSGAVYSGMQNKQNTIKSNNKLSADLVDDTNTTHKFVSSNEKTTWNNKVDKTSSSDNSGSTIYNTNGEASLNSSDDDDSASIKTYAGVNRLTAEDHDNSTSSEIRQDGQDIFFSQTDENDNTYEFNIFNTIGNGGTIKSEKLDIAKNLNLWSIGTKITYVTSDWYTLGGTCNNGYQSVLPNTTYTLSISESHQIAIGFYNTNKAEISSSDSYRSNTVTFTTPANCYYIHINYVRSGVSISWAMLNKGSSALTYMPYILPSYITAKLGAFDVVTKVVGSTYTIKRQTGICNVGRRLLELDLVGGKNMSFQSTGGGTRWGTDYHNIIPADVSTYIDNSGSGLITDTSNVIIHAPIKFTCGNNDKVWATSKINGISPNFISLNLAGITSFDDYWDFFSKNDVIIEYRTSSSYEEDITA